MSSLIRNLSRDTGYADEQLRENTVKETDVAAQFPRLRACRDAS